MTLSAQIASRSAELMATPDPKEAIEVVRRLRRALGALDDVSAIMQGSFSSWSLAVEHSAQTARSAVAAAAEQMYYLLEQLEDTPTYKGVRQATLEKDHDRRTHD